VFDLLMRDGKDCRRESLLDRKQKLRRLLGGSDARIQYLIMWMAEESHYSSNRASTIWKALLQNRVVGETSDSRYTCSGQPGQKRRQRAPSLNDRAPFRRKSHTVSVAHSAGPATGSSVLASTDARAIMSEGYASTCA
jgi:hypothetical protein